MQDPETDPEESKAPLLIFMAFGLFVAAFAAVGLVVDDEDEPSDTTRSGPDSTDSYLLIREWENAYYDDVAIAVNTYEDRGYRLEGEGTWAMEGESDSSWRFRKEIPCSSDTATVNAAVSDSRGHVLDQKESHDVPCEGGDHAFKVRVSPGGALTMTQLY